MTARAGCAAIRRTIGLLGRFAALLLLGGLAAPAAAAGGKYAAIVVDATSGTVLHAENADELRYPASLTKMMTLYLTFEALDRGRLRLDQKLPVSKHAAGQPPSRLGLRPGQTIEVEDAILALVTKSANDVAVVLAEALGGSEWQFATLMTKKARALGMSKTTFRNASGLPDAKQRSTVRDMARLAEALIQDHPARYDYFSRRSFTYRGTTYRNHNKLLGRYRGMDGLKTGYIRASGFNLAASAERDGRRLIAVVFGGKTGASRDRRVAQLLDQGFAKAGPGPTVVARAGITSKGLDAAVAGRLAGIPPLPPRKPGLTPAPTLASTGPSGLGDAPVEGWGVQIGAFAERAAGEQAVLRTAAEMPELMVRAVPQVIAVETGDGTMFRARLMGLDEPTARAACVRIEEAGGGCLTVPPQQGL